MIGRDGNATNAGVRSRTADKGDILHARKPNVGHELSAATHEAIVLLSEETCPDALRGRRARCRPHGLRHRGITPASPIPAASRMDRARARIEKAQCTNIAALLEMDAGATRF